MTRNTLEQLTKTLMTVQEHAQDCGMDINVLDLFWNKYGTLPSSKKLLGVDSGKYDKTLIGKYFESYQHSMTIFRKTLVNDVMSETGCADLVKQVLITTLKLELDPNKSYKHCCSCSVIFNNIDYTNPVVNMHELFDTHTLPIELYSTHQVTTGYCDPCLGKISKNLNDNRDNLC